MSENRALKVGFNELVANLTKAYHNCQMDADNAESPCAYESCWRCRDAMMVALMAALNPEFDAFRKANPGLGNCYKLEGKWSLVWEEDK